MLLTTTYTAQIAKLPRNGRHIIAQFDAEGVVVYQAYRPAIGEFAATHGYLAVNSVRTQTLKALQALNYSI